MTQNNLSLLTKTQFEEISKKYTFRAEYDNIVVYCNGKITTHPIKDGFSINTPWKRISFTKEMLEYWKELEYEYDLLEIKQAYTILKIMYQPITRQSLTNILQTSLFFKEEKT